jgi:hypothetical protein
LEPKYQKDSLWAAFLGREQIEIESVIVRKESALGRLLYFQDPNSR